MNFDPANKIVQLCATGMQKEGEGSPQQAASLFMQAWQQAATDLEKFIAAHYVARHQPSIADKLHWDELALHHARLSQDEQAKSALPSLLLNIAKYHEEMGQNKQAQECYSQALSHAAALPADGYGNMIRSGIQAGIERIKRSANKIR